MGRKFSVLGFAAAVAGLIGLYTRGELFDSNPVTIALQVLAALLMVWARLTFGMRSFHAAANTTEGELVTHGPYAFVRNPIYSAAVLFAFAGAGAHLNPVSAALALLVLGGMLVRIHFEEQALRATYKDAYAAYCQRVKRLLPFVF
ncbi:MAG: isoprenylcysteine carboxylmethyltransferase family protein [Planctomycetes bacterium]|nr:isoprenylcysteine carboxylmethyltransferase family protein [Planctomycetota bacterium]